MKLTNNILALVLVVAIVISVGGTAMSVMKLSGRATTGTGKTNVTVSATAAISLADNSIQFGSGYPTAATATLTSNSTAESNWSNATNCDDQIVIDNTGNVDVNLTINASLNASGGGGWLGTGSTAKFALEPHADTACDVTQETWTTLDNLTSVMVCDDMGYATGDDTTQINIQLTIPETMSATTAGVNINIYAVTA